MEIVKRVCSTAIGIIKVPVLWTVRELIEVLQITEKVIAKTIPAKAEQHTEAAPAEQPAKPVSEQKPSPPKRKSKTGEAASKQASGNKTVTEQVLDLIQKSPAGITVGALKKTTEIESKQISNAVFRLLKQEKIEKKGRGVYIIRS